MANDESKVAGETAAEYTSRVDREFGKFVRAVRESRGWTQARLAFHLSAAGIPITQSTVAKLENGSRPTPIGEAAFIATLLGLNLESFFRAADDRSDARAKRELAMQNLNVAKEAFERARHEEAMAAREAREWRHAMDKYLSDLDAAERRLLEPPTTMSAGSDKDGDDNGER